MLKGAKHGCFKSPSLLVSAMVTLTRRINCAGTNNSYYFFIWRDSMESISQWWPRLPQGRLPITYRIFISSIFLLILLTSFAFKGTQIAHAAVPPAIIPGGSWTDTGGKSIQAHGEGMIKVGLIYYWFGEDRS
jgi:hypothetical protein